MNTEPNRRISIYTANRLSVYLLIIFLILIGGCSCSDTFSPDSDNTDLLPIKIYDIDSFPSAFDNLIKDDISIESAAVHQDTLMIIASYSGVCELSDFSLISSGVLAKSGPPQMTFYLGNNTKNETCGQITSDTLLFDLRPLKEHYLQWSGGESGVISIRIDGFEIDWTDTTMWYEF